MAKNEIIVLKFGGSSVANVERIRNAADITLGYQKAGLAPVVVVSAMGDTTDDLLVLAEQVNARPAEREIDMLISTGEQVSSALLTLALQAKKVSAISFTGQQVGILTDAVHTKARIKAIDAHRIEEAVRRRKIVVVTGFQGITENNDISTLGRGGSDLSAVALAYALKAKACHIYTDVDGIYTADPRIVKDARKLLLISFDEMLEMASLGAQVMQTRSIEFAKKYNVPLEVRSSLTKKEGTLIMDRKPSLEDPLVRGLALTENEAKVTICNVPDKPGMAANIFKELASNAINVDIIVQNVSKERTTDVSFTVEKTAFKKAIGIMRKVSKKIGAAEILSDQDIAKVSVVGVGMKSHPGVAAKVFKVFFEHQINIEMISTSEISISCIVKKSDGRRAIQALHKEFNLSEKA